MEVEKFLEEKMLSGVVEHVIYRNEETGYAVFRLLTDEDGERSVVVVGSMPFIGAGERICAKGIWMKHPSYGEQFKASSSERTLPDDEEAMLLYLSTGCVRGIGPVTAQRIVERFKEQTFEVLSSRPELLCEIRGITSSKAKSISESFNRQLGIRRLMEFLIRFSVPPHVAARLYKWYGNMAMEFLRDNPYILTDENMGVEFGVADKIAAELGFATDSPVRADAGILYVLEHNTRNGHVFIPAEKLLATAAGLLGVDEHVCAEALERLVDTRKVVMDDIAGQKACYLARLYEAERELARRLLELSAVPPCKVPGIEGMIDDISERLGIEYAPLQREAISAAAMHRALLLTGGPGTGKSTSVRGMLELFDAMGLKTALCSPTGRAAKRLSELTGKDAATVHRLLEVSFDGEGSKFRFVHDEDEPLDADAVILDETSMVDLELMNSLVRAIRPGARLIMVGDPDQLPSVGPGTVLKDLLECGRIATVRLTEIFRQAQSSNIVMGAHAVNRGEVPVLTHKTGDLFFLRRNSPQSAADTVVELCAERLPRNMGYSPEQIQVISPTRRGIAGTINLNRALQQALNPPRAGKAEYLSGNHLLRVGDRVMHIRNNYDLPWQSSDGIGSGLGVFNGDVGTIADIDQKAETVLVRYDDRIVYYPFELLDELEPAYAMTVHKSQGSEYPVVVFVASRAASRLLNRAVFYTAMTRAQELLVIVGEEEVVRCMVGNNRPGKRYSGLKYRMV